MRVLSKGRVWDKEAIQALIDNNDQAVARALMVVYANQTDDERAQCTTRHVNNVGFTSHDAEALTDIAQKWKRWGRWASARQCNFVRRKVRKYHRQILEHILSIDPEARKIDAREAKQIAQSEDAPQVSPQSNTTENEPLTDFHRFAM
jgi:hypothetical protein